MKKPFADLKKSEYADSIYYADLFKINNKMWMIMGYGKSDAARIASNNDRACDLSRDCVAIREESGSLYGRYDPGALSDPESDLHKFHKIDYVAYCLSPEQSDIRFKGGERFIDSCDLNFLSCLSVVYPYPAYSAQFCFTPKELEQLSDQNRRVEKFHEIVNAVSGCTLLIVPYMDTVEGKANLYRSYNNEHLILA